MRARQTNIQLNFLLNQADKMRDNFDQRCLDSISRITNNLQQKYVLVQSVLDKFESMQTKAKQSKKIIQNKIAKKKHQIEQAKKCIKSQEQVIVLALTQTKQLEQTIKKLIMSRKHVDDINAKNLSIANRTYLKRENMHKKMKQYPQIRCFMNESKSKNKFNGFTKKDSIKNIRNYIQLNSQRNQTTFRVQTQMGKFFQFFVIFDSHQQAQILEKFILKNPFKCFQGKDIQAVRIFNMHGNAIELYKHFCEMVKQIELDI